MFKNLVFYLEFYGTDFKILEGKFNEDFKNLVNISPEDLIAVL